MESSFSRQVSSFKRPYNRGADIIRSVGMPRSHNRYLDAFNCFIGCLHWFSGYKEKLLSTHLHTHTPQNLYSMPFSSLTTVGYRYKP